MILHLHVLYIGQCYRRVFRRQEGFQSPRPEFHVLCLGLHGSGKSTLLAKFAGESVEEIESTKGNANPLSD